MAASLILAVVMGSVTIPPSAVLRIVFGGKVEEHPAWTTIVWSVRLPRAVTASLGGAALSVAGLQMQTLFRNPLADPSILGVTSGAGLGVALVVLGTGGAGSALLSGFGTFGSLGLASAAAIGAGLVVAAVLTVSRWVPDRVTILVIGLMIGYLVSAVVSVLVWFANYESVRNFTAWGYGSFRGTTWPQIRVLAVFAIAALLVATMTAKPLDALLLGDRYAESMGVNLRRARIVTISSSALLAGVVTAFCGPIAFLGIAVPHLARAVVRTARHRVLLPVTGVIGASVALVCDVIAQMPGSERTLPLNAVTALVGAPVVIWVLLSGHRRSNGVSI